MDTDYLYAGAQKTSTYSPPRLTRRAFLTRIAIFIFLEAAFLLLCVICLNEQIVLTFSVSLSNAKAGFTVISIMWQLLATFPIIDISAYCFSSEWYSQWQRSHVLVPGRTDLVSTLTAGMIERIRYAISPRASNRFRAALVISLLCSAIRALVPGSLSLVDGLHEEKIKIQVATVGKNSENVTEGLDGSLADWFDSSLGRGEVVSELEQDQVLAFGLGVPIGWMVGWPKVALKDLAGSLRYPTDIVHFDFQCDWRGPDFLKEKQVLQLSDKYMFERRQNPPGRSNGTDLWSNSAIIPFASMRNNSDHQIVYLLNGGYPQTQFLEIDLRGLPAFNISSEEMYNVGLHTIPAAYNAILLVCNPGIEYSGGEAQLSANGTIVIAHDQSMSAL